jgi:O-antigen ligase
MGNVVLYCSHAYLYFFQTNATGFKPLYWYVLTVVSAFGLLLVKGWPMPRGGAGSFGAWLYIFLCYGIINAIASSQSAVTMAGFVERIENVALLTAFVILFMTGRGVHFARIGLLFVAAFGAFMNIVDFLLPTWTQNPGRAAGLYLNPNLSGYLLVLAMIGGIDLVPRRIRLLFCIGVGLAVLVTFSRSSWLLWAVAMIGLAVTGYFALRYKGPAILLVGLASVTLVYGLLTGGLYDAIAAAGYSSKLTPDTFARLGAAGGLFADDSASSRGDAALHAWNVFTEHPWFGAGLAYTREWGSTVEPHNLYLSVAAQGGIVGLGVILGLLAVLWKMTDGNGRVLLAAFAVLSLFSHNSLEQPPMLVIIALIAAMGAQPARVAVQTAQITPLRTAGR